MPLGNFRFGNPTPNPQNQNLFGQAGGPNAGQMFPRGLQRFIPNLSQSGIPMPQSNLLMKGLGGAGGMGLQKFFGNGAGGFMGGGPGMIQQGMPQQGFPQQGFQQQGLFQQGYPQQNIPQQSFPQQGFSQQGYPSQGFFSQGFPPQAYPSQGSFNQTLNVQNPPMQQPLPAEKPAKSGGIKGLISRFMTRRKG